MHQVHNLLACVMLTFGSPALVLAEEEGHSQGYSLATDLPLWGLVAFIGFIWAVRKLGWQSFVENMDERERKENEAIARAETKNRIAQEELRDRKGQLEAIDETTREFIEEARRDAVRTRTDIVASATSEAESLKRRALREVERTRDQSLKELFDTMSLRVVERTEQRLRETLTPADQQRLMDESLTEFTTSSMN